MFFDGIAILAELPAAAVFGNLFFSAGCRSNGQDFTAFGYLRSDRIKSGRGDAVAKS